jgi:NADH:ubiquinone oxidoreductase subunit 2 (subunit N)
VLRSRVDGRIADHRRGSVLQDRRRAVPPVGKGTDAYEGAPTSVTGFMSVAVKAAAWAMLLRIFVWGLYPLRTVYFPLVVFVALVTMTGANLAALTQNNLKRLLAYSSIAHVGYMLLGLVAFCSVDYPAAVTDGFVASCSTCWFTPS